MKGQEGEGGRSGGKRPIFGEWMVDRTAAHDTTWKLEEVSMDVCLPGRNIGTSSGEHWANREDKMTSRAGWHSGWRSGTGGVELATPPLVCEDGIT